MTTLPWKIRLLFAVLTVTFVPTLAGAQATTTPPNSPGAVSGEGTSEAVGSEPTVDTKTTTTASKQEGSEEEATDEDSAGEKGGSSATSAATDGATYQVRLRDLEQRVDELKEQIRRSHTRLSLLSDTILSGGSGGARAEIEFVNDLSGAWHVVEAVFVLDGAVQYKKADDTGVLAKQKRIPIFSGSVPTGDHTLQVMLKLRGHGFGVFSYLRGIEASLTSDHSFTITGGKVIELKATAWEQGGPTTPVEQQPDVRFQQLIRSASDRPKVDSPQASTAPVGGAKKETTAEKGKVGGGLSAGGSSSDKK